MDESQSCPCADLKAQLQDVQGQLSDANYKITQRDKQIAAAKAAIDLVRTALA